MPLVKVEEQVFSKCMADIVGTTVASRWWQDHGGPTVASRWWADVGKQRHRSPTVDRWWQFAAYSHWRTDGVVLSGMRSPPKRIQTEQNKKHFSVIVQ